MTGGLRADRKAEFDQGARADLRGVPLARTGDFKNLLCDDFLDGVRPILRAQQFERGFVSQHEVGHLVGIERTLLNQSADRQRPVP